MSVQRIGSSACVHSKTNRKSFSCRIGASWIISFVAFIVISDFCAVTTIAGRLPIRDNAQPKHLQDYMPQDFADPDPEDARLMENNDVDTDADNNEGDPVQSVVIRQTRAADSIRHYDRIPNTRFQQTTGRRGTIPPDDGDGDDLSLESNREFFLDLLDDNAKHRHRKRPSKRHSKLHLKYDFEAHRYAITEDQSEEW